MSAVELVEITAANRDEVLALHVAPEQQQQHRGYGAAAVQQVMEILRDAGSPKLLTSYVVGPGGPAGFYAKLGFTPTGDVDRDGEVIVRLDLTV